MKSLLLGLLFAGAAWVATPAQPAYGFGYCGPACIGQMQGYCPSCMAMAMQQSMPWGGPSPWWWLPGPMMYSNFYSPGPWSYGPNPGISGAYYAGVGSHGIAKPNLYIEGPAGTEVSVKVNLTEKDANWLAAVPAHGKEGWKVTLLPEKNRLKSGGETYRYLYSDYRAFGKNFQDEAGFCTDREHVIEKMAVHLNHAGFNGREIADFIEFWSVKLPPSRSFCVYPQDERQLNVIAPMEVSPKPAAIRRVVFMVQVEEGLKENSKEKFAARPTKPWSPEPLRMPAASEKGIVLREWGVGFIFR